MGFTRCSLVLAATAEEDDGPAIVLMIKRLKNFESKVLDVENGERSRIEA